MSKPLDYFVEYESRAKIDAIKARGLALDDVHPDMFYERINVFALGDAWEQRDMIAFLNQGYARVMRRVNITDTSWFDEGVKIESWDCDEEEVDERPAARAWYTVTWRGRCDFLESLSSALAHTRHLVAGGGGHPVYVWANFPRGRRLMWEG